MLSNYQLRKGRLLDPPNTDWAGEKGAETESIQLWLVDLDDKRWDDSFAVLSQSEVIKAEQFHSETQQKRYRRCRCALRIILANHSKQSPFSIAFQNGRFGKPELKDPSFYFNLGHSRDKAIIGVSSTPLGVDIEYLGSALDNWADLIELVCHDTERRLLNDLPEPERIKLFYRLWTQKESYSKALGVGLSINLKKLRFDSLDGGQCFLVCHELSNGDPAYFVSTSFHVPDYVLSVCSSRLSSVSTVQYFAALPG